MMRPNAQPAPPEVPAAIRGESDAVAAFVTDLRASTARDGVVAAFWAGPGARTPLIEPHGARSRRVTFLFRDSEADAVHVTLNRISHTLEDSTLERVPGTDVWHATFVLDSAWRGSYTVLAADARTSADLIEREPRWAMRVMRESGVVDPRNPATLQAYGGVGASVAELPDAPPQPHLASAFAGETRELTSPSGRRVWVHRPARAAEDEPRPLVIALDGEVWHASGYAAAAVDHRTDERAPVIAMIDSGGVVRRMSELSIDGTMTAEIADELLPWLRTITAVSPHAADVIVSGESLGGLTALRTAFERPDAVGGALSQSASLWQYDMLELAGAADATRLFLTVGVHEPTMLPQHRALRDLLAGSPHRFAYREYEGGHDLACWRGFFADGVDVLFPPSS
ncbi:enterochelin esterase domain-containing protein [Microbacterium gorillae]|uniref:enterochelin esterase domain-containing protein n=1 Tax=Microbacterium gorillae TaxID=1231063 RepID=UPI000693D8E8|nr:enterochelin esterase domain-containing protein [Microbacterium gorillae]